MGNKKFTFEMPKIYCMCLRTQPYWPLPSLEAQMGGSIRFMETHEQLSAIISNDFIWFWYMMPWPHHQDASVRMAGSPQVWWQTIGHWQSGTGRRRRTGGARLVRMLLLPSQVIHSGSLVSSQICSFLLLLMAINSLGQLNSVKWNLVKAMKLKEINMT